MKTLDKVLGATENVGSVFPSNARPLSEVLSVDENIISTPAVPKFKQEFPNFPVDAFPALPAGFEDSSWHNDVCPSITNEKAHLHVFIDFPAPQEREEPSLNRFFVNRLDADGCLTEAEPLLQTDDWEEVMLLIEPKLVRAFSSAGPCLTLGRLTKETAQFYCFEEWRGGDKFAGAKKVMKPLPGRYSGNHIEPCRSCRDHASTSYPNGHMD